MKQDIIHKSQFMGRFINFNIIISFIQKIILIKTQLLAKCKKQNEQKKMHK